MIRCFILGLILGGSATLIAAETPDFETQIAPIIAKRCLECHNARDTNGKLVLITAKTALAGGESGAVIVPGQPDASPLIQRIAAGEMPPPRRGKPQTLPDSEQKLLRAWIETGAKWP